MPKPEVMAEASERLRLAREALYQVHSLTQVIPAVWNDGTLEREDIAPVLRLLCKRVRELSVVASGALDVIDDESRISLKEMREMLDLGEPVAEEETAGG